MAVFTCVDPNELQALLTALGLGHLQSLHEVAEGVENSTYFVDVMEEDEQLAHYVLTLLEVANHHQIDFCVALMAHLYAAGLPVPQLLTHRATAGAVHCLSGKPALLCKKVAGFHPASADEGGATEAQCRAIGGFLGAMHVACQGITLRHYNLQGLPWAAVTLGVLIDELPAAARLSLGDQALLREQIARYRNICEQSCEMPVGAVHADLFRDNTLFMGDELKAVIDFNSACTDYLLLDVAIVVNDWACDERGELDAVRVVALLESYQVHRVFTQEERQNWQDVLCFAAVQFYLSRLVTRYLSEVDLTRRTSKNPDEYRRKLLRRLVGVVAIP